MSAPGTAPVLVFGATGTQGAPVAAALLDGGFRVRAAVRHPDAATALTERGAEAVAADLADPEAVRRAADGVELAFLHLPVGLGGPSAEERARAVVDALMATGVRHLVFNTGGPTPDEPVGVPPLDARVRIMQYVLASGRATVLRPTAYMENLSAPWSAPRVAGGELLYPRPADFPIAWITNHDVGACTRAALGRPESIGQAYVIAGPEALDGPAAAERLTRALGREVHYREVSGEEYAAMLEPFLGPRIARAIGGAYGAMPRDPDPLMTPDVGPAVAALGVRLTPMEEWARGVRWDAAAAVS